MTIIKSITKIITMDDNNTSIENGAIVIERDRIVDIGKNEDILRKYPQNDEVIDGSNTLALPGFINCHAHLQQTILRGVVEDKPLTEWLKPIFKARSYMNIGDAIYSNLLGCKEMLRFGITTVLTHQDMLHIDEATKVIAESGIRACIAIMLSDYKEVPDVPAKSIDENIKEARRFATKWHGKYDGRINVMIGPVGLPASTIELMKEAKELARELGLKFHTHAAENRKTQEDLRKKYGKSEIEILYENDLLDQDTILAHCIHLSDKDIEILARTNTNVVHCPSSNMKLANGIAPIPKMIEKGVNVCLGTDGAASNNRLDMIIEMRMAALLHKVSTLDPTVMNADQVLRMATINGAKALGLDSEIGSIEKGKKADIILIDLKRYNLMPRHNDVANIVYSGSGDDVKLSR